MIGKCIFCLQEKDLTSEHVIPEFLGGKLKIQAVCKDCNSRMGSDFEDKFAQSFLTEAFRERHNIRGKSGNIPNPFKGTHETTSGEKVQLGKDLKPYLIPEVSIKEDETGVGISMSIDKADEALIDDILRKKLTRYYKDKHPDATCEQIKNAVNRSMEEMPHQKQVQSLGNPTIRMRTKIDLHSLRLLILKIAYEICFYHHGDRFLNCAEAMLLRDAINGRSSEPKIVGEIPSSGIFGNAEDHLFGGEYHYILLTQDICYIKLIGINSIVKVADQTLSLSQEKSVLYRFHHQTGKVEKHDFWDYIASVTINQQP